MILLCTAAYLFIGYVSASIFAAFDKTNDEAVATLVVLVWPLLLLILLYVLLSESIQYLGRHLRRFF